MSTINIVRGELPAAAKAFDQVAEDIKTRVNRLIQDLEGMGWDGNAREAFRQVQIEWDRETTAHKVKLQTCAAALVKADSRHMETDEQNAQEARKVSSPTQQVLEGRA